MNFILCFFWHISYFFRQSKILIIIIIIIIYLFRITDIVQCDNKNMSSEQDAPGSLQAFMVAFKKEKHRNTQNIPKVQNIK